MQEKCRCSSPSWNTCFLSLLALLSLGVAKCFATPQDPHACWDRILNGMRHWSSCQKCRIKNWIVSSSVTVPPWAHACWDRILNGMSVRVCICIVCVCVRVSTGSFSFVPCLRFLFYAPSSYLVWGWVAGKIVFWEGKGVGMYYKGCGLWSGIGFANSLRLILCIS